MRQAVPGDATRALVVLVVAGTGLATACVRPAPAAPGPAAPPGPEGAAVAVDAAAVATEPASLAVPAGDPRPEAAALPGPGHATVDVLIVYGTAMASAYDPAALRLLAQHAVDRANLAFYASRIGVQLRLVGAFDLSAHEGELSTLDALRTSPTVAVLRRTTRADLVQSWSPPADGSCGLAYQNLGTPAPAFGYSVVNPACVPTVAPLHEWGHNLGAGHDRVTDGPARAGDRAFPDSYGHVSAEGGFATIMAYDGPACPRAGCERVYLFSNPDVAWRGFPTGIAGEADNARAIRALGPSVAAYG